MEKNRSTTDILIKYTVSDWEDWIDDIIHFQLAYPISNIKREWDDLVEIVFFMQERAISTKNYEIAFVNTLYKTLPIEENSKLIERFLNALIILKFSKAKDFVNQLFFDNRFKKLKGEAGFIFIKSLNVLARLPLSDEEKEKINERIIGVGNLFNEYHSDEYFTLNYLRYLRIHFTEDEFYSTITKLFEIAKNKDLDYIIQDAIVEYYMSKKEIFYKHLTKWLIREYSRLKNFTAHLPFLKILSDFISHPNRKNEVIQSPSNQANYYHLLQYALKLVFKKEENDLEIFVENLGIFYKLEGGELFVDNVIETEWLIRQKFGLYKYYLTNNSISFKIENEKIIKVLATKLNSNKLTKNDILEEVWKI